MSGYAFSKGIDGLGEFLVVLLDPLGKMLILSISFGFCSTFDEAPRANTENITSFAKHDGAADQNSHDRNQG